MKKLFLPLILVAGCCLGQTERSYLYKSKLFNITQKIENEDTTTYFCMSYQNEKYQYATDLGLILLWNKSETEQFADDLIKIAEKPTGIIYGIQHPSYLIDIYDFSNEVFISDKRRKYFSITRNKAVKLAEEIKNNLNLMK